MNEPTEQPNVDVVDSYIWHMSPAVTTTMASKTYHTELTYGWSAANPLIIEAHIALNLDSVPLDDRNYPEGHVCDKCLLNMPYGTVAIAITSGTLKDGTKLTALWCIACARAVEFSRWYGQNWEFSLQHVRDAIADRADYSPGEGDVQITRPTADSLTLKLTGVGESGYAEHCFINVPLDRIQALVHAIDRFMLPSDLQAVEDAFVDAGLDALEALANGEI